MTPAPLILTAPDLDRPDSPEALRQAYTDAGLYRYGIPFDRAMADPAISICLRNTAHAVWCARRGIKRRRA